MNEIDHISEKLYDKIRNRFESLVIGDESTATTNDPEEARFFSFDFVIDGKNYGNMSISIADSKTLKIFYGNNITEELEGEDRAEFYDFLLEMRKFAKRNLMNFDVHNITRPNLTSKDFEFLSQSESNLEFAELDDLKEAKMSKMFGSQKSSYQKMEGAKIIVRHKNKVDENVKGARSRNIKAIYIENRDGERFKLSHNYLPGARAMARHVNSGGTPHDSIGNHITEMVSEMASLQKAVRGLRNTSHMMEDAADIFEAVSDRYGRLRETIRSLQTVRGYSSFAEGFDADALVEQDEEINEDDIRETLTQRIYNSQLDEMLPTIIKAISEQKRRKFQESSEALQGIAFGEEPLQVYANPERDEDIKGFIQYAKSTGQSMEAVLRKIVGDLSDRVVDDRAAIAMSALDIDNPNDKKTALHLANKFLSGKLQMIKPKQRGKVTAQEAYEKTINMIAEGTWALPSSEGEAKALIKKLQESIPAGIDGNNASNELYNLLGDDKLFDNIYEAAEERGPEVDVRPLVVERIQELTRMDPTNFRNPETHAYLVKILESVQGMSEASRTSSGLRRGNDYDLDTIMKMDNENAARKAAEKKAAAKKRKEKRHYKGLGINPDEFNEDEELTGKSAYQIDKNGEFYVEFDEDIGLYCVFGSETGFCYATYADDQEAQIDADRMNASVTEAAPLGTKDKYMNPEFVKKAKKSQDKKNLKSSKKWPKKGKMATESEYSDLSLSQMSPTELAELGFEVQMARGSRVYLGRIKKALRRAEQQQALDNRASIEDPYMESLKKNAGLN